MISGLCREFSSKSKREQDDLFKALLDAPVMHVDGTVARVNCNNKNVVVCSNGTATMYFARENKGHAGIKETPIETFGGILIHDHEACFYSYGSDHQECMVHIERYLRDGYNLYKRIAEYKHNHLLFLSNPLVDADNNLCERKARVLKGKINQAISLRSFEHLTYFCECLSVLDHFATSDENNLFQSVKEIFKRPKPIKPKNRNRSFKI